VTLQVQVFVKVVTIVVGLGLIHGLIVLPIVYAAIPFKKTTSSNGEKKAIEGGKGVEPHQITIHTSPQLHRRRFDALPPPPQSCEEPILHKN